MRILIVASFIPYPPDSGARIRTWEVARQFQQKHEVVFGLHVRTAEDEGRVEAVRQHGFEVIAGKVNKGWRAVWVGLREILSGGPPLFALRRSHELEEQLARAHAAEPFDVIQIEHFELARYAQLIARSERDRDERVYSMVLHDVLSGAYRRMAQVERSSLWRIWRRYNAFRLKAAERRFLPEYTVCVTVSENDRAEIVEFVEPEKVHVLPNCVDSRAKTLLEEAESGEPAILFVGLFLHPPNSDGARWMVNDILPQIRRAVPKCSLYLVGDGAPSELKELCRQPGVFLTGRVDDVAPYYARCQVSAVSLRAGGGTRLKILEAMAYGRPVVSTTIGAEGLPVINGEHLLLADGTEEFARACVVLLQDCELRSRLRRNARRLVEHGYRWEDCAGKQLHLYGDLVTKRRSSMPEHVR